MDADRAQVIWLFDVAADPAEAPVMLGVDELASLVEEALASAGLADVAVEGVVANPRLTEGAVKFDLVSGAGEGSVMRGCRVTLGGAGDVAPTRAGQRVRAWGRLRCRPTGAVELEAARLDPLRPA